MPSFSVKPGPMVDAGDDDGAGTALGGMVDAGDDDGAGTALGGIVAVGWHVSSNTVDPIFVFST